VPEFVKRTVSREKRSQIKEAYATSCLVLAPRFEPVSCNVALMASVRTGSEWP
jgi:hypothetical protein